MNRRQSQPRTAAHRAERRADLRVARHSVGSPRGVADRCLGDGAAVGRHARGRALAIGKRPRRINPRRCVNAGPRSTSTAPTPNSSMPRVSISRRPAGQLQAPIWRHDGYAMAGADLSVPLWTSGKISGSIGAAAAGARGANAHRGAQHGGPQTRRRGILCRGIPRPPSAGSRRVQRRQSQGPRG